MTITLKKVSFLFYILCIGLALHGQAISLAAGKMKGIKINGKEIQHLEGNVHFEQGGSTVSCDIADYDTEAEELTGNGNVKVVSNDGVVITGNTLMYSNKTKMARVEGNVKLVDKDMTLTTPWLNYNTDSKIGWYGSRGKIVDKEMTLTSVSGSYNPNIHMLYFKQDVLLIHPDYTIKADTLQYNSKTGTSYFFSYTEIVNNENTILCNYGEYNAKTGKSYFTKNAALISKENIIRADTLIYDKNSGEGSAFGHLWVKDTAQAIIIFGQKGYYNKKRKITRVTGAPIARKYEKNGDSLMLKADTLIYHDDSASGKKSLIAWPHVGLWRTDFSGTADSMSYISEDSVFRLFGKPVLWNTSTRLNADTMRIWLQNSKISKMHMRGNSFVAIEEDTAKYSQISGNNMDNTFTSENKLKSVWVNGNGKSIYYIREKDSIISSANTIVCTNMKIFVDSNKVNNVRFYEMPVGIMYPIAELPAEKEKLLGFIWDSENRPMADDFIPGFEIPELPKRRTEIMAAKKNKK